MSGDALWQLSAAALAAGYAAGRLDPVAATEACLARAAATADLNALVTPDPEGARAAARASAARWRGGNPLGPLDGVPLTVKDNIPVAGLRTTWGSRLYADHVPARDETPVARLREAGAVILGKTNVPEMTLQGYTWNPLFGTTRNPWDPALTPGGSSGGAVAAVAAGIGPVALCTDGGGSIRRPASHAGLVGLKPTTGRVPRRDGLPPILLDFEVIGPVARTVADLAAVMAAIAPGLPASEPPGRLRVLHVPRFGDAPVDPEVAASTDAVARRMAALGHAVATAERFTLADAINAAWPAITQAGLAWLMRTHHPGREAELGPDLRAMAEAGAALPATAIFDALNEALALRAALADLFAGVDVILTPAAAALPWPADEPFPAVIDGQPVGPRGAAVFTGFVNAAGCPAIAIPGPPSRSGLPIGAQCVGPWGSDARLIGLAAEIEAAHPWPQLWRAR
jgi:aspartyl-tRNA(Asn)/glutamyl-tRNA(Gln) amidotransferase subunit A